MKSELLNSDLFKKYDVPAPRYTSYPTVPYWEHSPSDTQWVDFMKKTMELSESGWALYVHLPFCETLCTFCGCNTSITKDHSKEKSYIDLLIKELDLYLSLVPELKSKPLRQVHLGGGSPTFFSAENLNELIKNIRQRLSFNLELSFEGSIEVDPRRTKKEQLEVLRKWGFNRISLGVQDFDEEVQRLVNRIQPFEQTKEVTVLARKLGYESVNFDLIYGLAKQTPESIKKSAELTVELNPDRIALYSLALVPWIKPQQKLFKDEDLPQGAEKRLLYEIAREVLIKNNYMEIGMDHFALPTDELYKKTLEKKLHRNFMGYTDQRTDLLLGIGVSSISETPFAFHQNEKVLNLYEQKINKNILPSLRGHILNDEDQIQRKKILKIMTEFEIELSDKEVQDIQEFLNEMFVDGLIHLEKNMEKNKLIISDKGRPFLRNVAVFFDLRLRRAQPQTKVFSQSI